MVMVHTTNTKHITIANMYITTRDSTSTHYNTGDVNAHSTLWHSYTDDRRGQLIADVNSNSDHITLNTVSPTRVPHITIQQATSPNITTLYNRTTWQQYTH